MVRKTHIFLLLIFFLACAVKPALAEDFFQLGLSAANRGEYDEALTNLNKALEKKPDSVAIQTALGIVYANKKMYKEAVQSLKKALELDANRAIAYYVLGMVYEELKKYDEAISAWRMYLSIQPRGGRSDTAKEHLRRLEE